MEISNELLATIVGSFIMLMVWLVKKNLTKDEDVANTDNVDSKTISSLSETIDSLTGTVKELKEMYDGQIERSKKFAKESLQQAERIGELEAAYGIIVRQNEKLSRENVEMEIRVAELEKENEHLRKMYVDGKIEESKK